MALVHAAFHQPQTRIYRIVQTIVWGLIFLSVVTLATELIAGAGRPRPIWLARLNRAILMLFAVELVLRVGSFQPPELRVFDRRFMARLVTHVVGRLRFCLRPLIVIDIVTVAALVPALRGLRVLRLLRLIRAAQIFRYSRPFGGLGWAYRENSLLFALASSCSERLFFWEARRSRWSSGDDWCPQHLCRSATRRYSDSGIVWRRRTAGQAIVGRARDRPQRLRDR